MTTAELRDGPDATVRGRARFGPTGRRETTPGYVPELSWTDLTLTPGSYKPLESQIPSWRRSFVSFLGLLPELDSDVAPPAPTAIEQAQRIGEILFSENLPPDRVSASAEGGVVIVFEGRRSSAAIECYDSGEVVFVISRRDGKPTVWEVPADDRTIVQHIARLKFVLR